MMLLKKLETRGFKSFAEKLTIEFGRGITAIVGPNGSGKSNITDAIRWVLGEQNMRTLRGAKSEDIIFSGTTEGRRPLGMAEVSITLDNSDHKIPLDYSEIEIMRRVFRSGENEYYLNRSSCRLKDIQEILFGTGMGKNNLSVIGQNKVDEILNSKPEERRLIFEEAAGIAKYKQRKKESLRKLEDTTQNLVRIEDVTTEIEGQLPAMKSKAENTEKYLSLAEKRTQIQETILFHKIKDAQEASRTVAQEMETIRAEADDLAAEMTIFDTRLMQLKEAAAQKETDISKTAEALDVCRTEAEQLKGRTAILTERINQTDTRMALFREELSRLDSEEETALKEIEDLHGEEEKLQAERSELLEQQVASTREQNDIVQMLSQKDDELESIQRKIFSLRQTISLAEENMRHQTESARNFAQWQAHWKASLAETESSLKTAQEELVRIEQEVRSHEDLRGKMRTEQENVNDRFSRVTESIRVLKMQQMETEKKYHALHSRYTVLASMQKEYEGFSRAGKQILSRRQAWNDHVYGAVAELIKMNDEVVTAIETALGASLQNIVVDTEETAQKLIAYLKENRLGRATFLPLTSLQVYPPRPQEKDAAKEIGAIGIASDLVVCESKYRPVIEFLLNHTVIVKTLDDAVRIARKYRFRVRLITCDGDVLNSGGSMTGGSRMRKEAGFLSRSAELDTLRMQEAELVTKRKEGEVRLQALGEEERGLFREREMQAKRREAWQQRANELHVAREKTQFTQARLAESLTRRQKEAELRLAAQQTVKDVGQLQETIEMHRQHLTETEMRFDRMTEERDALYRMKEEKTEKSVKLQVALSSLGEREQFLRQEQIRLRGQVDKYCLRRNEIRSELADLEKITAEQSIEKENCTAEQKVKQDRLLQLSAEKEIQQKERYALLRALQDDEQTEKMYRKRSKELEDRLHRTEMQYAKQQYEYTRNQESLEELGLSSFEQLRARVSEHEITLDAIELVPLLRKVERAIQSLGPINPSAVEEYRALEERYTFLAKQQADLIEAKTYLTDVIAQIDRVMEKSFAEAFQVIDGHFRTIFSRIFGGGQARLELTDRGDMLTTGIEIIAQPPGKKQQNMVLLSGGERALTVIALLFAFLEYRPMPFVVVDEIDAPLDEANLERFVSFLREFAEHTQFIIITHRKVTMRAADVMHGVTNEDAGVSRIISVKMEEVE